MPSTTLAFTITNDVADCATATERHGYDVTRRLRSNSSPSLKPVACLKETGRVVSRGINGVSKAGNLLEGSDESRENQFQAIGLAGDGRGVADANCLGQARQRLALVQ